MPAPTLGTISVDAENRVQVPVDDFGGHAMVRVDYAVSLEEPPTASHSWVALDAIASPATVETPPMVPGSTVWIRASGRLANGERSSVYTTAQQVDIEAIPTFASISIVLIDRRPVIAWEAGPLTEGVRISWELHDPDEDPGSLANTIDLDADDGGYEIDETLDFGQAITVVVEAWSAFSGAVGGDQGQVITELLVVTGAGEDPQQQLACRLYFSDTLDFYLTNDHCLVLSNG